MGAGNNIQDAVIIQDAIKHISYLQTIYGDAIPNAAIREGFLVNGETVRLENKAVGIFKPRQMKAGALSIKTTIPRTGRRQIYNDQLSDDGFYHYSLQQGDPRGGNNKYLWQSLEMNQPFIYFHAIAPAVYTAIWPCFVKQIHVERQVALIEVGSQTTLDSVGNYSLERTEIESRYRVQESKVRLHQASFRAAVLDAYKDSCAITGLPEPRLLEAAHILPDSEIGDKQLISNGIALNRLHHKAFDGGLLRIKPDYTIAIGDRLKELDSSKYVRDSFLKFDGEKICVPNNPSDRPDPELLEIKGGRTSLIS